MSSTATRNQAANALTRLRSSTSGELLAEFLGTFILVLLGCGSVAVAVVGLPGSSRQAATQSFGPASWLIVAFGWGLAVVFGVYIAGGVSGGHINPAVTLAFAVRRRFPWVKVIPYWAAQFCGAFAAAAVVYAVYVAPINFALAKAGVTDRSTSVATFSIFATYPANAFMGSVWGPFVDQIVGTAILVCLIAALIDSRNMAPQSFMGPFLIGWVVLAIGFSFGTNAGYAINPARDLGPRVLTYIAGWGKVAFPGSGPWFSNYWWIPIAGPLIGGVLGILIYDFFVGQVLQARKQLEEVPPPGRVSNDISSPDETAHRSE